MVRKIIFFTFTAISALLISYIIFFTVPKASNLSELVRLIESKQRITAVRDRNLSNIDSNKAAIHELQSENRVLENTIVPKSKLVPTILNVSDMLEEHGLQSLSFKMTNTVSIENMLSKSYSREYKQAEAEFSAIGHFNDISDFLNAWKKADIKYMVDGLAISRYGISDEKAKMTVKFSVFFSE